MRTLTSALGLAETEQKIRNLVDAIAAGGAAAITGELIEQAARLRNQKQDLMVLLSPVRMGEPQTQYDNARISPSVIISHHSLCGHCR
jgi:hypothetical protein